jgi:GH35 family endo-1,4-beta-xylanase
MPQVKGAGQYASNLVRAQPRSGGDATVQYADVHPLGINTFLQLEVEVAKREKSLQMIREAGFRWIRQEFPWEDIEIHGKGDLQDRRWTPHRSSWEKYDNIVDLAEKHDIEIICRLSNPPSWARADGDARGALAPPDDYADYGDFVYAVVSRYRGRIRFYQIWNEPNLGIEWGGNVNAREYTELLKVAYTRAKEADPDSVILAGALSATIELNPHPPQGINDFVYLQQMYDAGAAPYFDIMSMQGYGLFSGPTDRRMRPRVINFSRPRYIREMMVVNGDAHKPIWISELDWSPVPDEVEPKHYGQVTEEARARYVVQAYERMREEWPWMGVACFWFFKRPDDSERGEDWYYFRMVESDFTPLPVYQAMKTYAVLGQ